MGSFVQNGINFYLEGGSFYDLMPQIFQSYNHSLMQLELNVENITISKVD